LVHLLPAEPSKQLAHLYLTALGGGPSARHLGYNGGGSVPSERPIHQHQRDARMKFQNFDGTNDKGRREDSSATPVSTTASEATKRDAAGTPDRESLVKAIEDLRSENQARNARKLEIELELSQLRRTYQICARRMPQAEYAALCGRQSALNAELGEIRTKSLDANVRIASLTKDMPDPSKDKKPDRLDLTNQLLRQILVELKDINSKLKRE
jgi:hypothetical protein